MSERRTPYRAPRRRPLEPQAPLRREDDFGHATAVLERHQRELMCLPGVGGVGISRTSSGAACIRVFLANLSGATIPPTLDDVPVEIEHVGEVVAAATPPTGKPQGCLRYLAALPPGDERAIAERLLLDLTAYYGVQGWRGVDGVLAGRCRITIQALLGALAAAQRRQTPSETEGNAP